MEYEDLKKDLFEQLNGIDERMIDPASQAKELLTPLKKTIKKRQDKKVLPPLCFNRYNYPTLYSQRS